MNQPYPITQTQGPFRITHVMDFERVYPISSGQWNMQIRAQLKGAKEPQIFFVHMPFRFLPVILIGDGSADSYYGVFSYPETSDVTKFEVELPSDFVLANRIMYTHVKDFLKSLTEVMNRIPNLYELQTAASAFFDVPISDLNSSYIFTLHRDGENNKIKFSLIGNLNPQKGLTIAVRQRPIGGVVYQSAYSGDHVEIYEGDSLEECLTKTAAFWGRHTLCTESRGRRVQNMSRDMTKPASPSY